MYRRSPLGNPLLWVVACLVLPEVVKKCKPLAKVVGDTLVNAGEAFRKAAKDPDKAEPSAEAVPEPIAEQAHEAEPETGKPHKKPKASPSEPPADGETTETQS